MNSLSRLSGSDKALCAMYAVIAACAVAFAFGNTVAYFVAGEGGFLDFFAAGYVNHATSSLTNDLFLVGLAAVVLMVVEGRRLGMRYVWVYVVASFAIAVSVAFPLFLLARQLTLAATQD